MFVSLRGAVALERLEFSVRRPKSTREAGNETSSGGNRSVQCIKLYCKVFGLLIVPHSDTIAMYFVEWDASVVFDGYLHGYIRVGVD